MLLRERLEDRERERQTTLETVEDLRKRLDAEQEERRALQRQLAPPAPERPKEAEEEVKDLRKRLEDTEAWIAALTAPERPQDGHNRSPVISEPQKAPRTLWARLLGRGGET
jgi:chromosome segregation ATPase